MARETPTENQFTQRVNTLHYFVSLICMFWGYTPTKPCLTVGFNNPWVLLSFQIRLSQLIWDFKDLKFGRSRVQIVCWGSEIAEEFAALGATCINRESHFGYSNPAILRVVVSAYVYDSPPYEFAELITVQFLNFWIEMSCWNVSVKHENILGFL